MLTELKDLLPIETERLELRGFTHADFEALLAMQSRADVTRYLPWGVRGEAEVWESLGKKLATTALEAEDASVSLAVVRRDTEAVIGDFSLLSFDRRHRQTEIGFILHPDHQGQGFATESAEAMLRLGFEVLGFHRVYGRVDARNTASSRVLERLGMRCEAHFVRNELLQGEWTDELVFAILEEEWREAHG